MTREAEVDNAVEKCQRGSLVLAQRDERQLPTARAVAGSGTVAWMTTGPPNFSAPVVMSRAWSRWTYVVLPPVVSFVAATT